MTEKPLSADLLAAIVAATRRIVEVREQREPASLLAARAERRAGPEGRFRAALAASSSVPRVIAECKRRSPARGVLRVDYDPVAIARGYEAAGAAAISVLTEPTFFDGSLAHLEAVRGAVGIPVLRKDFIVSEYQLLEARVAGADAVLLIVAALAPRVLSNLYAAATKLGLDVLVEVHNEEELSIAVDAGAAIVGVNNRSLRTLQVDVGTSAELIAHIPRDTVAVSESGLKSAEDLLDLAQRGFHAFLIGERFMSAADPGEALHVLLDGVMKAADPTEARR